MNKRIRKKKDKQQRERIDRLERLGFPGVLLLHDEVQVSVADREYVQRLRKKMLEAFDVPARMMGPSIPVNGPSFEAWLVDDPVR